MATKRHSKAEAMKLIRRIQKEGTLSPTSHFKEQMQKRGFEMRDVIEAIKKGMILDESEPHEKTGNWIYKVVGRTVDGKELKLAVQIIEEELTAILLTGF